MIYKLEVPELAEDVTEVRVLEWHGAVGSRFEVGDMIVELETHKAIVEIRAGQTGVFRKIEVRDGEWCRTGMPLGFCSDAVDELIPEDTGRVAELMVRFEIA
jgi:pyruvate/2-oxoglutarate dehydrogenase complex dihydrolipoamide acyltransferase (E2) component